MYDDPIECDDLVDRRTMRKTLTFHIILRTFTNLLSKTTAIEAKWPPDGGKSLGFRSRDSNARRTGQRDMDMLLATSRGCVRA